MSRAGDVLRQARLRSGLTQSGLAALAAMPQSVISEYETGRREPSFEAVDRLLTAAGLVIEVSPAPTTKGHARDLVLSRAGALRRALRPLGAERIRLFGSVARGEDTADSDVDLLVDIDPAVGMFSLLRMQREAEAILGRPVDLIPNGGLKPAVADEILREAIVL